MKYKVRSDRLSFADEGEIVDASDIPAGVVLSALLEGGHLAPVAPTRSKQTESKETDNG